MTERMDAYELVFQDPADTLVVYRTDRTGPGGHPVYADDSGIVQAEISDRGEIRMIATGGQQTPARPTVRASFSGS
jgi:hypothetical protein